MPVPVALPLIAGGLLFGGGFYVGRGFEGAATTVKWVVIGGIAFAAYGAIKR